MPSTTPSGDVFLDQPCRALHRGLQAARHKLLRRLLRLDQPLRNRAGAVGASVVAVATAARGRVGARWRPGDGEPEAGALRASMALWAAATEGKGSSAISSSARCDSICRRAGGGGRQGRGGA